VGKLGLLQLQGQGLAGFPFPVDPRQIGLVVVVPTSSPWCISPPPAEAAMLIELSDDLELEDLMELIAEFMQRS
jgi:hypothetical protein